MYYVTLHRSLKYWQLSLKGRISLPRGLRWYRRYLLQHIMATIPGPIGDMIRTEDMSFSSKLWTAMITEYYCECSDMPFGINLSLITKLKREKKLQNSKVPLLGVLIKDISHGIGHTTLQVTLKDISGEIPATIDISLKDTISPGCVVVIRNVTVLSPVPKKTYIIINPENIVKVYRKAR